MPTQEVAESPVCHSRSFPGGGRGRPGPISRLAAYCAAGLVARLSQVTKDRRGDARADPLSLMARPAWEICVFPFPCGPPVSVKRGSSGNSCLALN